MFTLGRIPTGSADMNDSSHYSYLGVGVTQRGDAKSSRCHDVYPKLPNLGCQLTRSVIGEMRTQTCQHHGTASQARGSFDNYETAPEANCLG
jgi:hypothetical protein